LESINNLPASITDFRSLFISILDLIFKESPEGIVYKDHNLYYRCANTAFCNCYNIKNKKDFIGKKEASFLSKENQKIVTEVSKNILEERKPISYIMSFEQNSNSILNITSTPIFINNNLLGIISTVKDITYDECIKQQFVNKHFQIKSLLENIPMLIYMQDCNFNFIAGTKYSKEFVKQGYDAYSNIYLNLNKSQEEENNENKYVLESKKILTKEKEFLDCNDCKHWYKIYKVPITDFNSNISGIITLANNIDAEKQLQAQRETFVASLGHDLKNPTIAQIRSLELLLKGCFGDFTDEQKEILEMILDSCRYMNGMLATLLATYRNYGGTVKLNFEKFSFLDLVEECVSEMIYIAKDKNIDIKIIDNLNNKLIEADRVQIKRVIMNLLSNGIKYAYANTSLNINLYRENSKTCFDFCNKSPYISEDKQKSIFTQYVSYASAHNELGIGLGLYASKRIIEGHEGEIFVISSQENTNIFGFKIPQILKEKRREHFVYF